jgi:hypothetical protein
MKSITLTNGQKVYRRSFITTQSKHEFDEYENKNPKQAKISPSPKESQKPKFATIKLISPKKDSKKELNIIETPKKPIIVDSKNQKISVTKLLTEMESPNAFEERANEDNIQKKLESLTKALQIKETTSVGNSKLNSDDSSIIMKSDFTEDPISRRSISPIKSISILYF